VQPSTEDMLERFWENVPKANPDAAILTWLDDSIGALLGKLRELGLEENTLVFFLSDHQSIDKFSPFERGAHVPMAVSWKGRIRPRQVSSSLVASLDITATMVDVGGAAVPADCVLDGFSMVPMFGNPKAEIRDSVLIEFGYARAVVTKEWQYVALRFPEGHELPTREKPQLHTGGDRKGKSKIMLERHPAAFDPDQLYDLRRDPGQEKNEWDNPEYKAIREKHKELLGKQVKQFPHTFGEFAQR
ncbi:MAG: sulfatase-like hydrolase/transferase, partial [Kiritimatiellales bacterium]|nr:sulfatase-like hydrolase/transferase [Kiritimatiellales bacterium]